MKNLLQILVKRESADDQPHYRTSSRIDDIDLIQSPRDGSLVVVGQGCGVHLCFECEEQFVDDPTHPLRMAEVNPGGYGTRMAYHARCVPEVQRKLARSGGDGSVLWDPIWKHQAKRLLTKVVKPFQRDEG